MASRSGASLTEDARNRHEGASLALGLLGIGVLLATWSGLLLVVGARPLPGWVLAAPCLVVALVLLLVRGRHPRGRVPRWVAVSVVGVAVLGVGAAALADVVYGAAYRTLDPASDGGCRVVVRETSFLMAGRGEVFVVAGSTGVARRQFRYVTDDAYRPFTGDDLRLTWRGDQAGFTGLGPDYDPLGPGGTGYGVGCD